MTTVRCYVPVSVDQLVRLETDRVLSGPLLACAVTDAVQAALPTGDIEEWEYAALQEAARRLVALEQPVIVAAVDVTADRVRVVGTADAQVEVGDVDLPRVASLHLGDDVVTGDTGAVSADDPEIELSWYDTTELAHVIEVAQALAGEPADTALGEAEQTDVTTAPPVEHTRKEEV